MKGVLFTVILNLVAPTAIAATPVERDAMIDDKFKGRTDVLEELVTFIKAHGYRCDSISAARPMVFSRGFVVRCNQWAYEFEIEDKGGKWRITVK